MENTLAGATLLEELQGLNGWRKFGDDADQYPTSFLLHKGKEYIRCRSGFYHRDASENMTSVACEWDVQIASVTHSIHDGSRHGIGNGKTWTEDVVFCPKCETRPDSHGLPTRVA